MPALKYKTLEELETAIDLYFTYCDDRVQKVYSAKADGVIEIYDPEPYTMSGLAYTLGLSRQALTEYSHKENYGDAIKKARNRVEMDVERRLLEGKGTIGAIFNLKNNFGWRDKQETELTGRNGGSVDQTMTITYMPEVLKPDYFKPDADT